MDSWLVLRNYRVILNQWTKWNNRSFEWLLKTSLVWSLPIRQEILNVSSARYNIPWNLSTNFHPDLISTILQTYLFSLCALLFQQSHLFPICVVSTYNDSRKDLQRLFQIPKICQCNDFRFPIWLQKLLQTPLCFLWSFCFARIWLDPLSGQVLHHVAYRWLFRNSLFSLRTL